MGRRSGSGESLPVHFWLKESKKFGRELTFPRSLSPLSSFARSKHLLVLSSLPQDTLPPHFEFAIYPFAYGRARFESSSSSSSPPHPPSNPLPRLTFPPTTTIPLAPHRPISLHNPSPGPVYASPRHQGLRSRYPRRREEASGMGGEVSRRRQVRAGRPPVVRRNAGQDGGRRPRGLRELEGCLGLAGTGAEAVGRVLQLGERDRGAVLSLGLHPPFDLPTLPSRPRRI